MYPTPAEPTILLSYLDELDCRNHVASEAATRIAHETRATLPSLRCALNHYAMEQSLPTTTKLAYINPRFVRKKQGSAGAGYIT